MKKEPGEAADEHHGGAPVPGGVDAVFLFADGAPDVVGDAFWWREYRRVVEAPGHGGVDEGRFYEQGVDAAVGEAVLEAAYVGVNGCFGGVVDSKALSTAITNYGGEKA